MSLPLLGDEAFYWQCGRRLALAYADHPFMTALLVRAGTSILGDTPLAVRLLFLACGALLPVAVFVLARPLVGARDAWLAAGLSAVVPGIALAGALAVPDAPLLLLGVLALGAFERATRTGSLRAWLAAGALSALGFATHARFAVLVAGAFAYLVVTHAGRAHVRRPGPWLATAVMAVGLLPITLFNAGLDWAPLRYQIVERHSDRIRLDAALTHVAGQAFVVGPLLYGAALAALVALVLRAPRDDRAALVALAAGVPLAGFLLGSPWSDRNHDNTHWPLAAYPPLLVFVPGLLRRATSRLPPWTRGAIAGLVPGVSAAFLAVFLLDVATGWVGVPGLHRGAFMGRAQGAARADAMLERLDPAGRPRLVVGDHYLIAAHLEFRLRDRADVFVLDHARNHRDGRALQYALWGRDESGLRSRAGQEALVVVERSTTGSRALPGWLAHVRGLFDGLEPVGELSVRAGNATRRFLYFRGRAASGA